MINLKEALVKNQFVIGSWITIGSPAVAEVMCQAGFEWLTIDLEHSVIELEQAQQLIAIIGLYGISPLVRVGDNNAYLIKRVMDAGARGVIVPMVNSREDAEKAVAAVRYPPEGKRGVGLARAQAYGYGFKAYKDWLARESVVIAQIEHIKAVENLRDILNTPGIDGTIIGPYDLSGSMGYPGEFQRSEVQAALNCYEEICREMNKPMGIHVVQPDAGEVAVYTAKGYSFIAAGVDFLFLGNKCREVLQAFKA